VSHRRSSGDAPARRRPSRLRRWVAASAGGHLVVLAVLIPLLAPKPEPEAHLVTEVDLVDLKPETQQTVKKKEPAQPPRERRPRVRRRRALRKPPVQPAPRQQEEESAPELLIMRQPEPAPPDTAPAPPTPDKDRFASFWAGDRRPGPAPETRERLGATEVTRYADGGVVLRGTAPPNRAAMGLLDLAAGKLGHSSGSQACNPYRSWNGTGRRELVLIVDTSGSVVRNRRAPASLVCAAGAALAALKRGFSVTVINFSSFTQRYGPTEDIDVVYRALSTFQAQGTVLPRPELLKLKGGGPRDYVLISDAAIHNLKQVVPAYGKALRADPRNRALLYYLGGGGLQDMNPAEALELLRRTGFKAEQVDKFWADS
jgi:hypothetical protein